MSFDERYNISQNLLKLIQCSKLDLCVLIRNELTHMIGYNAHTLLLLIRLETVKIFGY